MMARFLGTDSLETLQQNSAFGAKPQQVAQPVPGEQEQQDLKDAFASSPDAPPPGLPSPDEFAEYMADPVDEFAEYAASPQEAGPERPTVGGEALLDMDPGKLIDQIITDVGDLGARVKASFAGTELSKLKSVRSSFPDAEVTRDEKGNIFIDEEGKPTRKLDKDSIGLIENIAGDLIADNARLITEGVIENSIRLKGMITGAVLGLGGGPAAPITVPVATAIGTSAAGAVGAVTALEAGDFIQEKIFGIERDPERAGRLTEAGLAVGFGAGFNFLGSRMARSKAARDLLKKGKEKVVETLGSVKDKVKEVEGLLKQVNESGLVQEGKEIKFTPGQKVQTLGDDVHLPEVKILEGEMSRENNYRAFRQETANAVEGAYDSARKLLRQEAGVPADLGESIGNVISDEKAVWGKYIGEYRLKVNNAAAGKPQAAINSRDAVTKVADDLGIDLNDFMSLKGDDAAKSMKLRVDLIKKKSGLDRNKSEVLAENLFSLVSLGRRKGGKISLVDIEDSYKTLRNTIDSNITSPNGGRALSRHLIEMKDALERDRLAAIGELLPDADKQLYSKSMGRYSEITGAMRNINKHLLDNKITRGAFAKEVFSKKAKALPQLRALKTIIQKDRPELWNEMSADFVDHIIESSRKKGSERVDWANVRKMYRELDPSGKFQKELFEGTPLSHETMDALTKLGGIEFSQREAFKPKLPKAGIIRNAMRALMINFGPTRAEAVSSIIKDLGGGKNAAAKYLASGGLEDMLKMLPQKDRGFWRNFGNEVVDLALEKAQRFTPGAPPARGIGELFTTDPGALGPEEPAQ